MTDEVTPQAQPSAKKEEKKQPSSGNNRGGPKRHPSNSNNQRGGSSAQGGQRSNSRGPKPASAIQATESGSDTNSRKGPDTNRNQQRNKSQANRPQQGQQQHRKPSQSSTSQGPRNGAGQAQGSGRPSPAPGAKDSSDALSSLQRVIADLKTTSPVQPPLNAGNSFNMAPQAGNAGQGAPFQQAGTGYGDAAKHRKAVSLGQNQGLGFNSYSPNLGSMLEDAEDGPFEEGEIPERFQQSQQGHQPRSQSQSFVAPRFAALAAEQGDNVGPTGRPQLAPGFMFGARKRSVGMGPAINEDDVGFQFPQQQGFDNQQPEFHPSGPTHRKAESGEITGIMAEQVSAGLFVSLIMAHTLLHRLLFRTRSRPFNNNSKPCISSNSPPIKSFHSRHPVWLLPAMELTAVCRALSPWAPG